MITIFGFERSVVQRHYMLRPAMQDIKLLSLSLVFWLET